MGLTRREVILLGIENNAGYDPGLGASDAILVSNPSWANEGLRMHERNPVSSTLGKEKSIYGGSLKAVSFEIPLKGSGTIDAPPEVGKVLRLAGLAETINAATSVVYQPASSGHETGAIYYYEDGRLRKLLGCRVNALSCTMEGTAMLSVTIVGHKWETGTAQAGAATTITLDANASAVDDTYNGQTIEIIRGTGAGQSAVISDYVGSTQTATVPAWTTVPDNTSVYKISGGPIDAAVLTPTYDATVEPPFIQASFTVGGYAAIISSLSWDLGIEFATPPNVNDPEGFGEVRIIGRDVNGSFNPEATLVATNDFEADFEAGTEMALDTGVIGSTEGNRFQIQMPAIAYRDTTQGDRDGVRIYEIPFGAAESSGDDEITITFT